jgi:hypothetical protein
MDNGGGRTCGLCELGGEQFTPAHQNRILPLSSEKNISEYPWCNNLDYI